MIVALLLVYLVFPAIILFGCHRYSWLDKIGAVMLSYAVGVVLGNSGILPSLEIEVQELLALDADQVKQQALSLLRTGEWTEQQYAAFSIYQLQDTLMSISILLALPLLLFSTDLQIFFKSARSVIQSLVIAMVSVCLMVFIGFFIFRNVYGEQFWKIGGMLVGVYTGGTPNLASLKMMLDVEPATYIVIHSYDLIVSFIYLVFLLTLGKQLFRKILSSYQSSGECGQEKVLEKTSGNLTYFFQKKYLKSVGTGLALSILIVGLSAGVALQVPKSALMVTIILMITSLSLILSLIPAIRNLLGTFDSGMYLILIFSLVVASMVDIRALSGISPEVFGYLLLVVFGSLLIQLMLSKLFKIDADTMMITSVAFVCSPPFVPVLAGALKNRQIIVPGISIGVVGYALGNYLGYLMAELLRGF
jgi:uncharacterized membrane protein